MTLACVKLTENKLARCAYQTPALYWKADPYWTPSHLPRAAAPKALPVHAHIATASFQDIYCFYRSMPTIVSSLSTGTHSARLRFSYSYYPVSLLPNLVGTCSASTPFNSMVLGSPWLHTCPHPYLSNCVCAFSPSPHLSSCSASASGFPFRTLCLIASATPA